MGRRSSHIHHLIDDLTAALDASPGEQVQRRLRYALALLHATVESLDELDASSQVTHLRARAGERASVG
jgi:hypothetical protein